MIEVSADRLIRTIQATHGCKATLREACPVCEEFKGQTVWEGVVHVFSVDHDDAGTCYAWSAPVEGSDKRRFCAVLGIPPINSAQDAVRAAIVADHKGE